jgi:hypothetical protein
MEHRPVRSPAVAVAGQEVLLLEVVYIDAKGVQFCYHLLLAVVLPSLAVM